MTDGTGTGRTTRIHPFGQPGAGQLASVDGPWRTTRCRMSYDELGRVVSRTLNGVTSTWHYDQLGRLENQTTRSAPSAIPTPVTGDRVATVTYPNGQITQLPS